MNEAGSALRLGIVDNCRENPGRNKELKLDPYNDDFG
jgi:hypothetical protein